MTTQTNGDELERKKFEKWFKCHYCIPGQFIRHDKSGDYENLTARASWRAWLARSKHGAAEKISEWISVKDRLPENQDGRRSKDVIALSESGGVFKLACMGGYWQRTTAFINSGASEITHWMPLNPPEGE